MEKNKGKEKIFTPGNIILGVIIIVLIGSLFFDFFGSSKQKTEQIGCPQPIEGLLVTNVVYSGNGVPYTEDRATKPRFDPTADYEVSALLRNIGSDDIAINSLLLTKENMGTGDVFEIDPIIVKPNTIKKLQIKLPSGDYHKIDFYSTACNGVVVFHESGEGSVYKDQVNSTQTNTTTA